MEELKPLKGKQVSVPKVAKRYGIAFYRKLAGWQNFGEFHVTPESALGAFVESWHYKNTKDNEIRFYQVYELELEIPYIIEE